MAQGELSGCRLFAPEKSPPCGGPNLIAPIDTRLEEQKTYFAAQALCLQCHELTVLESWNSFLRQPSDVLLFVLIAAVPDSVCKLSKRTQQSPSHKTCRNMSLSVYCHCLHRLRAFLVDVETESTQRGRPQPRRCRLHHFLPLCDQINRAVAQPRPPPWRVPCNAVNARLRIELSVSCQLGSGCAS